MATPKKRRTKGARNQGRNHKHLSAPTLTKCALCKSDKQPHHVCETCGAYKKRNYKSSPVPTKVKAKV